MVISKNSQLGLRFNEKYVKAVCLKTLEKKIVGVSENINAIIEERNKNLEKLKSIIDKGSEGITEEDMVFIDLMKNENIISNNTEGEEKVKHTVNSLIPVGGLGELELFGSGGKFFFICESVYKAAELIKVNTGFTGRTLKDIEAGAYNYLMGKNEMVRFIVKDGVLRGFYFNDKTPDVFEFGIEMGEGKYYFDFGYEKTFSKIMQVLIFVELGDIEILELKGGANNGGLKKEGNKVTNTTKNTVYVVDSSWNKLIIRTDGFAVRGHFRLQPCGINMADRKLIWIDAFEKQGYIRKPKASILHN